MTNAKLNAVAFFNLTLRGFRIFIRDRAGVFFSLLAPLIILMLYLLFLGDTQLDSASSALNGLQYDEKVLKAFVNGWMISGVVSVSCITVSFAAQSVMISDRYRGTRSDVLMSPVKRRYITAAYFACNYLITLAIVLVVLIVCFVYIALTGWYMAVGDVFAAAGMVALSALSASMISTLICTPIRSDNVHSAVTGILSAAIGFLMGAYMPVSIFPEAVQYIVMLVPGTYSAGVFRNIFANGALKELCKDAPVQVETALREAFALDMNFFGRTIGAEWMAGIFAITIALVGLIALSVILVTMLMRRTRR